MANADFNDDVNKRRSGSNPPGNRKGSHGDMNMKNVNWPGLPGKAQKKSRSGGVPKVKIYPVSEGL